MVEEEEAVAKEEDKDAANKKEEDQILSERNRVMWKCVFFAWIQMGVFNKEFFATSFIWPSLASYLYTSFWMSSRSNAIAWEQIWFFVLRIEPELKPILHSGQKHFICIFNFPAEEITWKVSSWRRALVVSKPLSRIRSWLFAFSGPWNIRVGWSEN